MTEQTKGTAGPPARKAKRLTPAEYETSVKKSLDKYGDDVFPIYQEILKSKMSATTAQTIFYWNLGLRFKAVHTKYKKGAVQALAGALEISKTDFTAAMRIYEAYPKVADIQEVLARTGPRRNALLLGHLRALATPDIDAKRRAELIDQCLVEDWSPEELAEKLRGVIGRPKGAGGRKPVPLKNLPSGLVKWMSMNTTMLSYGKDLFTASGLEAAVRDTPSERLTPETLAQLDQVDAQLDQLAAMTAEEKKAVAATRVIVEKAVESQAAATQAALAVAPEEQPKDAPAPKAKAETPKATKPKAEAPKAAKPKAAAKPPTPTAKPPAAPKTPKSDAAAAVAKAKKRHAVTAK